ncbi:hypothetical protein [Labilibacter marinus]|uniref:hypothetical protein n=1 Tax=Labilibacter marinus TaxID=1477105 RepID=UPI00094F5D41|nr:hypothetical protein [Labilibacter marinus]
MKFIIYIALLSVIIQGCKTKADQSDFPSAGVVTYSINYPEEVSKSASSSLMPDKMTLSFRDNKVRYNLKGSFNVFALDFFSPAIDDSCATIFRFMDNKLMYKGACRSNFFFFNDQVSPEITYFKDETKEIAGLTCRKGEVTFKGLPTFDIYYAESINIDIPNRHTPFSEVPGLLLEFSVDYNGVRFHFTAKDIDYNIPSKSTFKVPNKSKNVPESEIEDLIITLIHNFQ